MKKIIISLFVVMAGLVAASCTPDTIAGLDGGGLPKASELDVTITVDQTTNYVTFTMNNKEMTPMWIFSESNIKTQNGYRERFRNAGTYTVEVKAMNRNGISDASITKEFTVDNNYVVPSHPLFGTGTKRWKVASDEQGHMYMEDPNSGQYWWDAKPGEKADFGMYDDRVTFTQNGDYVYDPGPDGMTYVSAGTSFNDGSHNEDFDYPSELQETTYSLNSEETQLTLPAGTFLPWINSDEQLEEGVYTILELTDNHLILKWAGNGQGWRLTLVPADVVERDPLWGTGSKMWKVASDEQGHMYMEDPNSGQYWWDAKPGEKADFGMYDDRVIFSEDGTFVYDPGPDGMTYVSAGTSFNDGSHNEDFDYPSERQETTYAMNGENTQMTLPAGTFLPWISSDSQIETGVYTILELTSTHMILGWPGWRLTLIPADPPPPPPPFDPGAELTPGEFQSMLEGSWTWESSSSGHIGCGDGIFNPTGWWNGGPNEKENGSLYDDVITFGPGNAYKFDPVDGMTYMNKGVTLFDGVKVDIPYVDNADTGEGDWRIEAGVQESTYSYSSAGEAPNFMLPAGVYLSYIPADVVFDGTIVYYITAMWENQIEISAQCPGIVWRYRLKRVS